MERYTPPAGEGRSAFMPVALRFPSRQNSTSEGEDAILCLPRTPRGGPPSVLATPTAALTTTDEVASVMAEAKTITIRDVQSLADRLLSRGLSKLSDDRPEHAGDLRLAAKVIRAMARSFGQADVVTLENGNG
jgi:hypothetical protein